MKYRPITFLEMLDHGSILLYSDMSQPWIVDAYSYLSGVQFILDKPPIHTCQGSNSYLTDLRFILDTSFHICLDEIQSNLKYIIGDPEELMKCIYRPCGANEVYLPSLRD